MSCIKSIQRGTGSGNATITIKPVDVDKSIALLSGGSGGVNNNGNGGIVIVPTILLADSTTLTIGNAEAQLYDGSKIYTIKAPYTWQVIEFA